MPQCGIAKCDRCDYVAEIVEGWDGVEGLYRLPTSGPVPLLAQWIWCNRCSCICQVERLPKVEDIKSELRATVLNVSAWGRGDWRCTRIVTPSNTRSRWRHRRILKAIDRKKREVLFPWPMVWASRLGRLVPRARVRVIRVTPLAAQQPDD